MPPPATHSGSPGHHVKAPGPPLFTRVAVAKGPSSPSCVVIWTTVRLSRTAAVLVRRAPAIAPRTAPPATPTKTASGKAILANAPYFLERKDPSTGRELYTAGYQTGLGKTGSSWTVEINLPKDALDSLDAARYLRDSEEYWPFEGDDWPDEFVGSEGLK